jgi:copper transport protein
VGLAVVLLALLGGAGPASAHAALLYTAPSANQSTVESPSAISLVFGEPVTLAHAPVRLTDVAGHLIAVGPAAQDKGGSVVSVPIQTALGSGTYSVGWQVVSVDGDPIAGSFRFGVGSVAALPGRAPSGTSTAAGVPLSLARFALFASVAGLAGGITVTRLSPGRRILGSGRELHVPAVPWRSIAVTGVAASALLAIVQAGSGSFAAGLSSGALSRLPDSPAGRIVLVELAAFAIAAVLFLFPRPPPVGTAAGAGVIVVAAEAWRSHPQAVLDGSGAILVALHIAAAATWVGGLVFTLRVAASWRSQQAPAAARRLLADFARPALWLAVAVVVTGIRSEAVVIPPSKLFTTGYGQVLLVKIGLAAVAVGLAFAVRSRVRRPAPPAAPSAPSAPRSAHFEAGVLAGVLAATAVLVTLPTPPRASALSSAPPPDGAVLPLGARAGMIAISVQASTGELVVRLDLPNAGSDAQFTAAAALTDPTATVSDIALRGCGSGCFYAPLSWPTGSSVLTLDVTSPGWTGGRAALTVGWPTADGSAELRRATAELAAAKQVTVAEHVTSDSTRHGAEATVAIDGARLLATEPYRDGAPLARLMTAGPGVHLLALGYPAQHVNVLLTIDDTGRIQAETSNAPTHMTARTFQYSHQEG